MARLARAGDQSGKPWVAHAVKIRWRSAELRQKRVARNMQHERDSHGCSIT